MIHHTAIIQGNVHLGQGIEIGPNCVIEGTEDRPVIIGDNTRIMVAVEIRPGTTIGKDCYIDSGCRFSGDCAIGDRCTLRYETIIARGVNVDNDCYLCPRVMTNNLDAGKNSIGGAKIGKGCFIGTHTVLQHGITICDAVTVGAMSFVHRSIQEPGTYVGSPAKKRGG